MSEETRAAKRVVRHLATRVTMSKLRSLTDCNDINECVDKVIVVLVNLMKENERLKQNRWVKLLMRLGLVRL